MKRTKSEMTPQLLRRLPESLPGARMSEMSAEDRPRERLVREGVTVLRSGELLGILSPREQKIVELRFGLGGQTPLSLDEIGAELGITRERVRQIEARLLSKLRHPSLAWVEGRDTLAS